MCEQCPACTISTLTASISGYSPGAEHAPSANLTSRETIINLCPWKVGRVIILSNESESESERRVWEEINTKDLLLITTIK